MQWVVVRRYYQMQRCAVRFRALRLQYIRLEKWNLRLHLPYIKQMTCGALSLFGSSPICSWPHSFGYVLDAKLV